MSNNENMAKTLRDGLPSEEDYEVGYRKPPKETRFKKCFSGNPRGRPPGSKNKRPTLDQERLQQIILGEAYRQIDVRDGERSLTCPMAQAVMRSIAVNAAKGQSRAQKLFTEFVSGAERSRRLEYDELLKAAIEYKCEWELELEDRQTTGRTGPEPLPHPDDIEIDYQTGHVLINGPITKDEKVEYDKLRERKEAFEEEVSMLRKDLQDERDPSMRKFIEDAIRRDEKIIATMSKYVSD